ncbi:MAG: peptidoglycan DD-metalloendopeptidase family protein [Thermoanaerobaculia bacterium]
MSEQTLVPGSRRDREPQPRRIHMELQFHPADIRRPSRTFFLARGGLVAVAVAGVLLAVYLLAGLIGVPWAVRGWLVKHEADLLIAERGRLGQRLQQLVGRLDGVNEEASGLRRQVARVHLVYGLDDQATVGQGGFPVVVDPTPEATIYRASVAGGKSLQAEAHERVLALAALLDEIHSFEEAHADQVQTTPSVSPLKGEEFVLTSPFGYRRSPFTGSHEFHSGLDLAATVGTPVLAPADGQVVFAGRYPLSRSVGWWRYGNLVAIRHGERFTTLFGHCDQIHVARGQQVVQGQVIATVGNTGWSTSPHLHYEVRQRQDDGEYLPLDPRIYILDHQWNEQEERLVMTRSAPSSQAVEPLPPIIGR